MVRENIEYGLGRNSSMSKWDYHLVEKEIPAYVILTLPS
jgi:hypothetical protein